MPYLDHAATTPMLPEAIDAMSEAMVEVGNASSLHGSGRQARRRVEEAREQLGIALGARPSEIVFTSGGTESDNLAVKGLFWARQAADPRRRRVVASAIEHHAVLDPVEWLAATGQADVTWLSVDARGHVDPDELRAELRAHADSVALVSVMWANNEVGTVQPVAELAQIAHDYEVPLHTDAVQAVGAIPVNFADCGADAMTVTGHKLGGPVGAGGLLLRRDARCVPLLHGGGQERELRSGTLDPPGTTGFAVATSVAVSRQPETARRLDRLRTRLIDGVHSAVPDVVVNGHPIDRLPGIAHLSFPGCEGDSLLMLLDARGIECSTGSACSAGVARPSHVLIAMGLDRLRTRGSLRFSLGHSSTEADVDAVIEVIGPVVDRARRAGLTSVVL
jgi:cysteine desulfurase